MLTSQNHLALTLLVVGAVGVANSQTTMPPDQQVLVGLGRFQENLFTLRCHFAGSRTAGFLGHPATLKGDAVPKLEYHVDRFSGEYWKYGRTFRTRYRQDSRLDDHIAVSDGNHLADYTLDPRPDPSGTVGYVGTANQKPFVRLSEFLGVLYPNQEDILKGSSFVQAIKDDKMRVQILANGLTRVDLGSPSSTVYLEIDLRVANQERVGKIGAKLTHDHLNYETTETQLADYKDVEGVPVPTTLTQVMEVYTAGKLVDSQKEEWHLENLTRKVKLDDIKVAIPSGLIFQSAGGNLKSTPTGFAKVTEPSSQFNLGPFILGGLALFVGSLFYFRRRQVKIAKAKGDTLERTDKP